MNAKALSDSAIAVIEARLRTAAERGRRRSAAHLYGGLAASEVVE
jgi:hypothetical protein